MLLQAAAGYGRCTRAADVCMVLAVQGCTVLITGSVRYSTECGALAVIHNTNVNEHDWIYGENLNNLTN